ncbi:hypothetical protein FRC10_008710 [Ceratobasidium sp. 414]|nr:hypothetical protein FRC10_008710 [Ceratobasidium sp. 414]
MPQLESLRFDFALRSLPPDQAVNLNDVPRYRLSPFRILEANFLGIEEDGYGVGVTGFRCDHAIQLANYLFSLWPNVQIAAQPDEEEFEDCTAHHKMIALINDHLAALSCCNRDPSIKYEDIKILNEDSWGKCKT